MFVCAYKFRVEDYQFKTSASIHLHVLTVDTAITDLYMYRGNDRSNLTTLIEANSNPAVGASIWSPVDDGIVLLVGTTDVTTVQLSYMADGDTYPWWEQPWLGKPLWVYYAGVGGFSLAAAILLPIVLVVVLVSLLAICAIAVISILFTTASTVIVVCCPCASAVTIPFLAVTTVLAIVAVILFSLVAVPVGSAPLMCCFCCCQLYCCCRVYRCLPKKWVSKLCKRRVRKAKMRPK